MFIPLIEGEIFGFRIGIKTDLLLWEHCQQLAMEKMDNEYLVGIGVGFTKAQSVRIQLKKKNNKLTFERKQELYEFIVNKYLEEFIRFYEISNGYLDHIELWGERGIPLKICNEVDSLLGDGKIQRAIDKVNRFYTEQFRLEGLIAFQDVYTSLGKLREKKKKGEISTGEYAIKRQKIELSLRSWISKWKIQ